MSKKNFKTVEEAIAHIEKQEETLKALGAEKTAALKDLKTSTSQIERLEASVKELTEQKADLERKVVDAEQIAKDAIEKANVTLSADKGSDKVTVKLSKGTFEVLFGVDGLSKDDLAKDKGKCEILVEKGTAALQKIGG